ncbi:MAG TPA: hypothetical protein VI776_12430 [Anaerolineales bacterium]|nr:hypothetical protein [Anaerolineales bacterium]
MGRDHQVISLLAGVCDPLAGPVYSSVHKSSRFIPLGHLRQRTVR